MHKRVMHKRVMHKRVMHKKDRRTYCPAAHHGLDTRDGNRLRDDRGATERETCPYLGSSHEPAPGCAPGRWLESGDSIRVEVTG
jgi:hypothetical protein